MLTRLKVAFLGTVLLAAFALLAWSAPHPDYFASPPVRLAAVNPTVQTNPILQAAVKSDQAQHQTTEQQDHFIHRKIRSEPWSGAAGRVAFVLSTLLLGFGLTITTVQAPNKPVPKNSYAANVVIADGDASPAVVPIPAAFAAVLANYGGTGVPATNAQLKFVLTPVVVHAATAGLAVSYDGAGNLDIAHATGSTTGCTVYVEVAIPTTNNQP